MYQGNSRLYIYIFRFLVGEGRTWNHQANSLIAPPIAAAADRRVQFAGGRYGSGEASEEEMMQGLGEGDDDLLGDAMTEDLGDDMDDDGNSEAEDDDGMGDDLFNPAELGLKEINNLAHFGVSSHRPGSGVAELLSDDLDKYWQYVHVSFRASDSSRALTDQDTAGRMVSSRISSRSIFCAGLRSERFAFMSITTKTSPTRRPI